MSNLVRTTITIPNDIYQDVKILSGAQRKSFSGYITGVLKKDIRKKASTKKTFKGSSVFGKFDLGINNIYNSRSDLYKQHERKQIRH